jgi:hypothetical protein
MLALSVSSRTASVTRGDHFGNLLRHAALQHARQTFDDGGVGA